MAPRKHLFLAILLTFSVFSAANANDEKGINAFFSTVFSAGVTELLVTDTNIGGTSVILSGAATLAYCKSSPERNFLNAVNIKGYFHLLATCLEDMSKNGAHFTSGGSAKETKDAIIEVAREDLVGVVAGLDASNLAKSLLALKRQELGAAATDAELAQSVLGDLQ